jgi:hypothetical protein
MKVSILAVLFTICAIAIIFYIKLQKEHERLNLHHVRDSISFDTLHSEIKTLPTVD